MKEAKFCPSPTGSMIVKRTLPGGKVVTRRNITVCSSSTAVTLPWSCAVASSPKRSGNDNRAGSEKGSSSLIGRRDSRGTASGKRSTVNSPKRIAGGEGLGGGQSGQTRSLPTRDRL